MNKNKEIEYNIGILLKNPLKKLIKTYKIKDRKENIGKSNEIKISVKINKDDINKDIYFLDNTNGTYDDRLEHYNDNLKVLNESNTELYINDKKSKYKKYFKPDKEGIYIIKLKFNYNFIIN